MDPELLINQLCAKEYGVLILAMACPILIFAFAALNGLQKLESSKTCSVPRWIPRVIVVGSIGIFSCIIWTAAIMYDPIHILICDIVSIVKRAKVRSILAGGVVVPR